MITRNFKNILTVALQSASTHCGCLRGTDVTGLSFYAVNDVAFPYTRNPSPTLSANGAGISIGTGDAAATEEDYQLEATITGGVSMQLSATEAGCDSPGNPFVRFRVTVTNTGSEEITVREIGYKQNIPGTRYPNAATSASNRVCLIDRTVLETPLTLQGGDAGVILYKLSTTPAASRTVGGVELVSWEHGTDAQIAAMLDAAHRGDIDLQTDAHWRVGDCRMVSMAAFTDGSVAQNAQPIGLVISSFDEYEGCGNVMQVDLLDTLSALVSLVAPSSGTVPYEQSRAYTATLPAMAEALPDWLRTRLVTFNVPVSTGGSEPTLVTVPDNKLALRSASEVFGMDSGGSIAWGWEGDRVALYRKKGYNTKQNGVNGSNADVLWWTRSRNQNRTNYYLTVRSNQVSDNTGTTNSAGIAPFGCL